MNQRVPVRSLVLVGAACLCVLCASAQQSPPLAPEVLQKLNSLADQVKASLEAGDLAEANQLASDLMLGILNQRRAAGPAAVQEPGSRYALLPRLAVAAFKAGDLNQAEAYARELIATASDPKNWNYGRAIFFGNMIIGRVALRRDKNISLAKASLLTAARTTGGPELNSFGPNMSLAKDLIEAGERDTVLEFFELCRSFWKMDYNKLDQWTAMVKGGGMPDSGANLLYD